MKLPSVFHNKPLITELELGSTPVEIFRRLYGLDQYAFLYESLENVRQRGRYSFVGGRPAIVFKARKKICKIMAGGKTISRQGNPFNVLEEMIKPGKQAPVHEIFGGGAVGYVAYDAVRNIEKLPDRNPENPQLPEFYFIFPTEIIIFDHHQNRITLVNYRGKKRVNKIVALLEDKHRPPRYSSKRNGDSNPKSNMKKAEFLKIVSRAKDRIQNGDIFQVVLSQRFVASIRTRPFSIYTNLRRTNPSPYMYFLKMDGLAVLGSSPETLIKLQNRRIISRPIAGTRPRGKNKSEDMKLADELINDEKERAEHIMLVDLARNDVGRVSVYGSVKVTELMKIEEFSKVMHITSTVTGALRPGLNGFDVFKASFPAGTVSGAPKVRAMEIIDELETIRRGIYAGAIGYFGFDGNMDFCIAIRTMIIYRQKAYIQSGAGIVADSVPENEYQETVNKMSALKSAMAAI